MADPTNEKAMNHAMKICSRHGLFYKQITLVGSNFMSKSPEWTTRKPPVFVVLASSVDDGLQKWYTFTYASRARSFRNQTFHANWRLAELHAEVMVDTANFSHRKNIDKFEHPKSQTLKDKSSAPVA